MQQLSSEDVDGEMKKLELNWTCVAGSELMLSLKFEDFAQALEYVNKLGRVADEHNHHPNVSLGYGTVDVHVTTHSVGGLTSKDFELAKAISKIS